MKLALLLALIVSVTANIWLYRQWQRAFERIPVSLEHSLTISGEHAPETESNLPHSDTSVAVSAVNASNMAALKAMFDDGQYNALRDELQQRLRKHPDDIELLLLEAELMMKTEPLNEALLHYSSLLNLPFSAEIKERIKQRISHLLQQTIAELKTAQSWDLLALFLEPLHQQLPPGKQIVLALAEAYGQQRKFTLMEDTLASLPAHDSHVFALRQRLKTAALAGSDELVQAQDFDESEYQTLPLRRKGDHYLIEVWFGTVATTLLIDTGATTTALTHSVMNAITRQQHTNRIGVFNLRTAAGLVESEMNQVFDVLLGEYSFPELNVMTLQNDVLAGADGLLGMNVLRHFEFRIDQQRSVLLLKLNPRGS
ncbi:retroviral-like aspartic protease family protein [Alteromonas ponticola]|uniref:Retroviral-like aspartic protease family protein n=1 Tax=Alteromonas aquimaris TaxID=2998417 RepID=A0ABT3P6C3_9ALTE|nr:retropepsin-like aspartic protease [Alteromonas aquimaris]MCW8108325.1 retroviral-like aspartic protease family protein [Alteromonas aquimaris]